MTFVLQFSLAVWQLWNESESTLTKIKFHKSSGPSGPRTILANDMVVSNLLSDSRVTVVFGAVIAVSFVQMQRKNYVRVNDLSILCR